MIFKLCARSHPPLLDGFWSPLAVLDDHPKAVLHDHPNVAEALDANLNVEEVLDVHPKFGLKFWMFIQNLGQLEAEMNAGRHG